MKLPVSELKQRPVFVRAAPFIVFIALMVLQNQFQGAPRYWIYLLRTIVAGWMLWQFRRFISELRLKFSWEAIAVGLAVFVLWVGLAPLFEVIGLKSSLVMKSKSGPPWNPLAFFSSALLGWFFVIVRIVGSSVVVPPMEEVFFRSFLYRYVAKPDFLTVPLGQFLWTPFIVTSVLFGFVHHEWLAGILCGFAYQGLVCWKKRLGDAIAAHAITNFLLGIWVVHRGAWHFW
jgi:CAAX protease family protein